MRRSSFLLLALLVAASGSVFGQFIDPQVQISSGCSPSCPQTDPIPIATTGFEVYVNNPTGPNAPWYLVLGLPVADHNPAPGTPSVTSTGSADSFTVQPGIDKGAFDASTCPQNSCDVYRFSGLTATKIGSETVSNWFGSAEQAAFGGTPGYFEIFRYSISPALKGATGEFFNANLTPGSFVVAYGIAGQFEFSTPFTTAGLAQSSSTTTTNTTASGPFSTGGSVPEPGSVVLFGSVLVAVSTIARKKLARS